MGNGNLLSLLDEPQWNRVPLTGERAVTLLAVLAMARGRTVGEAQLIEQLWPDDRPRHTGKALHVVVSRARQATAASLVLRTAEGYRLNPAAAEVDAVTVMRQVDEAIAAWREGRSRDAIAAARAALAHRPATARYRLPSADDRTRTDDALTALRSEVDHCQEQAQRVLGITLAVTGEHAEAYHLLLATVDAAGAAADEQTIEHLLRAELAVSGAAAALQRYAGYRDDLADRLGIDPGPALQRLHAELLIADRPQRSGLRTGPVLIGRDQDVRTVSGLLDRSRVVTLLGTGGLGKTSLAHAVAGESHRPGVCVVELVGARTDQDVLAELADVVGSAESLRDRMDARRWRDVRGRVAEQLARVPSLLVVDNCEHVVDATAELVAFLVATVPDLRVLTTSRTPLAIAAEQVYPLEQLDAEDSAELFRRRASAARPEAQLPDSAVEAIVARLDGLPLAIELAAAKIRWMSAAEIAARLDDLFGLLRSGDRAAPDRHRTLSDLIEWSWTLLSAEAQRGMTWLALLPDGFTLDTASAVLAASGEGVDPLAVVEALVEQSLLMLREDPDGVRYRMLETLREFALLRLDGSGERAGAENAVQAWAAAFSTQLFADLAGPGQVEAMNAMTVEEVTLADVARSARNEGLGEVAVPVTAALTRYWTMAGQFARLTGTLLEEDITLCRDSPLALRDMARLILSSLTLTGGIFRKDVLPAREALAALGADSADPTIAAGADFTLQVINSAGEFDAEALNRISTSPDPHRARLGWQWIAHWLENKGDVAGAVDAVLRSLDATDPVATPVEVANLETLVASLLMQLGDVQAADLHAARALRTVRLLRAHDEQIELQNLHALALIANGRLVEAEQEIADLEEELEAAGAGPPVPGTPRAELCLVRGQWDEGLRLYREDLRRLASTKVPTALRAEGFEPWTLTAAAVCLTAHARFDVRTVDDGTSSEAHQPSETHQASDAVYLPEARRNSDPEQHAVTEQSAEGEHLAEVYLDVTRTYLARRGDFVDYPVAGSLLFALAWWHGARRQLCPDTVARLLALAHRFGYHRGRPTMRWEAAATMTTEVSSAVERWLATYQGRFGPDLHAEAEAALRELVPGEAHSER